MLKRLVRKFMIRLATWRLHRRIDELEERFVEVSADFHRRHPHREIN